MSNKKTFFVLAVLVLMILAGSSITACAAQPASDSPRTLTVMTHDSFAVSEEIITGFEAEHNAKVNFIRGGDTGSALNQTILSKENPLSDVFYGVDSTFLTRALKEEIFEPYPSALLEEIPDEFKLDSEYYVLPVDYGDVCINYDKYFFKANNLAVPQSLEDLIKPEYKGLLVTESPATSSPGLAFLMATIANFGEAEYVAYWQALKANGLVVVSDWETAYYTNFSGSTGQGAQPMVVSYGSSPAAEVIYAETELKEAPSGSIIGPNTCYRQIEFVGIIKGTPNRDLAEAFIDTMLSVPFQEDIPLQMFVFPVNQNAELPEVFVENVQIPDQPATLPSDLVHENRETWIRAWLETVQD